MSQVYLCLASGQSDERHFECNLANILGWLLVLISQAWVLKYRPQVLSIDKLVLFQIVIHCHRHHRSTLNHGRDGSVQFSSVHSGSYRANKVGSMPQYTKRICMWNWEILFFWGEITQNWILIPNKILNGIHSVIQANFKNITMEC
jgi:hypothetical protein